MYKENKEVIYFQVTSVEIFRGRKEAVNGKGFAGDRFLGAVIIVDVCAVYPCICL